MGAWIEINDVSLCKYMLFESHPTMGAWIEIIKGLDISKTQNSRTPRWVRGLKYGTPNSSHKWQSRTPRWVRGLKLNLLEWAIQKAVSHPTMGAWIEILKSDRLSMLI